MFHRRSNEELSSIVLEMIMFFYLRMHAVQRDRKSFLGCLNLSCAKRICHKKMVTALSQSYLRQHATTVQRIFFSINLQQWRQITKVLASACS